MQTNCIWDVILEIKPTLNNNKKKIKISHFFYTFLSHKTLHYFNLNKDECSIFWNVAICPLGPSGSSSENSMRYKTLCLWLNHIQAECNMINTVREKKKKKERVKLVKNKK